MANTKDILYMLTKEFNLERETTDQRLVLQKTIYLLQIYGLKLDYGFSWYRYGPYSQDLVQDAYEVLRSAKDDYETRTESLKFSADCMRRFTNFRQICGDTLRNPEQLELIASVDFARTTWYEDLVDETFISRFISERKKYLYGGVAVRRADVRNAITIVKKLRASAN